MASGWCGTCNSRPAPRAGLKVLLGVLVICATPAAALAQSFSATGQAGFLQEWEIKASLAKTATRGGDDYRGPVTLRHIGLCSADGVAEKSGALRLTVSRAGVAGTLVLADDSCRIATSAAHPGAGLLSCSDGQGIPITLSIAQEPSGADRTSGASARDTRNLPR